MTGTTDRVVETPPGGGQASANTLATRINALAQFARVTEPYLASSEERLRPALALIDRAGQRLSLSGEHTVVALSGPTGCGKSSLFNALAGMQLSPVGVRRPTTGQAHACVWGPPAAAGPVLDWLRVPVPHRFGRESALDGEDQARLRGLVLLDLPDFDSVEREHSAEVDRLLELVDLVVWVVDPQKYADKTLHHRQLTRFRRHDDVTLVALNQADRLRADELALLLKDLRRLLAAGGLERAPAIATSAVDIPAGLAELRAGLEQAVGRRQSTLRRLAGDLDIVVEGLAELVGPAAAEGTASPAVISELATDLATVVGVPAMREAVESSYRRRAVAAMDWPPLRWLRRLRLEQRWMPDLHARGSLVLAGSSPATDVNVALRVAAGLAAREVAIKVSNGLPFPWPDAVAAASRSQLYQLPDALTTAVAAIASEIRLDRTPVWWRVVAAGQWLNTVAVLLGLAWLMIGWILQVVALPMEYPRLGMVSMPAVLLGGGLLLGAITAALVRPVAAWAARRAGIRVEQWLRAAITEVGQTFVVAPVRAVLRAYGEARDAIYTAAGLR